jgi:hypothetical protein
VGRAVIAAMPTQQTNDMLTALILICSVTLAPDLQDCTRDNATAVMRVPAEFGKSAHLLRARAGIPRRKLDRTGAGQRRPDQDRLRPQHYDRRIR